MTNEDIKLLSELKGCAVDAWRVIPRYAELSGVSMIDPADPFVRLEREGYIRHTYISDPSYVNGRGKAIWQLTECGEYYVSKEITA